MKKRLLKLTSFILSITLVFTMTFVTPSASTASASAESFASGAFDGLLSVVCRALDTFLDVLLNTIVSFVPQSKGYGKLSEYKSENFYSGNGDFLDEAADDAVWSLGYAQRVLTPVDLKDGKYHMGGFAVANKIVDKFDDIKVRTVCIDDGSGRGKVLFSVIDAIGISNTDVRKIRAMLSDFAKENNIVSINVSATHTHSGIDTQGIWGVFGKFGDDPMNILRAIFPRITNSYGVKGVDEGFMKNVFALTVESMKEACESMTEGDLFYCEKDGTQYFDYRKDPANFIGTVSRLRFDPYVNHDDNADNDVMPTIITNFGCHPETVGFATDDNPGNIMSADFVPYMEKVLNDAGYNMLFIQGAIGAMITANNHYSNDGLPLVRYQTAVRQGEEYGYFLLGMTLTEEECIAEVVDKEREQKDLETLGENADSYTPWYENWEKVNEEKLDPILNVAHTEEIVYIDNPVVKLIGKLGVTTNELLKDRLGRFYVVTEIGYLEIGKTVKALLSPGETNPEFVLGGRTMEASTSLHRKDFEYDPLLTYFDETDHLLVFDEMNDAAGYINPDNDYALLVVRFWDGSFAFNANAFLFSFSSDIGSILIGNFLDLVNANK